MSSQQNHRGPAPEDEVLFAPVEWPTFRAAMCDLRWLLDHGYSLHSSAELVGNRYELDRRQRAAIVRCVCTTEAVLRRQGKETNLLDLREQEVWLDGFNVLTAVEVALGGGIILRGLDGCFRDVAGIHARYRRVKETQPALLLIGEFLAEWCVGTCTWWLDSPVSNSGRLKSIILDTAQQRKWDWKVELIYSPDKVLSETDRIVATADSVILDRCKRWLNLTSHVISTRIPEARLVNLSLKPD